MRTSKIDQSFAALERAADHAHLADFAVAHVPQSVKTRIASALNHCEEATSDLERFLGHAAADAKDKKLHAALYDAAKAVGGMAIVLREALASVEAFVELGGTARGVVSRAALEARVQIAGRSDAMIVAEVAEAFRAALESYDDALAEIVKAPAGFVDLLVGQRRSIARLMRELC